MKNLFLVFVIIFFSINLASAFDWTDYTIRHYYSSENASMMDNRMSLNGTNTGTTSIEGRIDNARYYDGTTMVNFTSDTFMAEVFYSFWFMTNSTGCTGDGCAIYTQWDDGGNEGDYITIIGDELHYVFAQAGGSNNRYDTTSANINTSQWTHVVVNGSGTGATGKYTIWVNGKNQTTTFSTAGANRNRPSGNSTLRLGEFYNPAIAQLQGRIDEFMIKNSTGTSGDVADLYNGGAGLGYGTQPVIPQPTVTLNSPANNTQIATNFTTYNATVTPNTFSLVNATLTVWFNNGTLFSTSTNAISGTGANTTTWNFTLPIPQNYLWNVLGVQGDANGTNSSYAESNRSIRYSLVLTNQNFFNATNYETALDYYIVNITSNGTAPTSAFLIYNNTIVRAATINSLGDNMYNVSASLDIPTGVSNNSFYFNFSLGGLEITTSTDYQSVFNTSLLMKSSESCDAGYLSYMNISFQDENNLSTLNGMNDATNISFWLGSGTTHKTLTTSNISANTFYSFCATPQNRTLHSNISFQYSALGYPARTYINNSMALTNATYNRTLYSLSSADGIYVTFQVINVAEQVLAGVLANVTKSIGGITTTIGAGITGSDGVVTYWLDPDNLYTANFFLSPYPFFSTTQAFTQPSYTVTLGSATSSSFSDYQKGIIYSINPPRIDYLDNNTAYDFNFTITSDFWTLERYGFNITDEDGNLYASSSDTTGSGGTVNVNLNTLSNTTLIMNAYWTINSTNTTISTAWIILDVSGNSFSISNLVSRFSTYVASGLFGLTNFGVGIICFLIIMTVTGTLKIKAGISNTASILGVMWALTALLDVTLGLIPNPVNAVPGFPTIIMGILFASIVFKEVLQ